MKTTNQINKLKAGGFILIDDVPCRIEKVSTSSSGKHGHSKVRVDAMGVLDGKRKSIVKASGKTVDIPIINKQVAQVLSVSEDHAQLMDMATYEVFELPIPEELKGQLTEGGEISYFELVGMKTLKQVKG
ncbi:MAG: translation initiation factor IF-5A [Kosmotogaceae bacterium]|nr:translation initiation factor IF-5A [Kosmotogaceae bacterium]